MRRGEALLALLLGACLLSTTVSAAPDEDADPAGELLERRAVLERTATRLGVLLARIRAGTPVQLGDLLGADQENRPRSIHVTPLPDLELPVSLPQEDEIAFERARLEAGREQLRTERVAPPLPGPRPEVAPERPKSASVAAIDSQVSVEVVAGSAPTPSAARDPLRLAEALSAAGELESALEAFRAAGTKHGGHVRTVARARYGEARTLERLGRVDEALSIYAAVEELPEAGAWAAAARFARRFIAWRRAVLAAGPQQAGGGR